MHLQLLLPAVVDLEAHVLAHAPVVEELAQREDHNQERAPERQDRADVRADAHVIGSLRISTPLRVRRTLPNASKPRSGPSTRPVAIVSPRRHTAGTLGFVYHVMRSRRIVRQAQIQRARCSAYSEFGGRAGCSLRALIATLSTRADLPHCVAHWPSRFAGYERTIAHSARVGTDSA